LLAEALTVYFKKGVFSNCLYSMKEVCHYFMEWVTAALLSRFGSSGNKA